MNQEALAAIPADLRDTFLHWAQEKQPVARAAALEPADSLTLAATRDYGTTIKGVSPAFIEEQREGALEGIWEPWMERAGGPGSPGAEAFNEIAKLLIAGGHTVPNYQPH